jgi:hypothetical protein
MRLLKGLTDSGLRWLARDYLFDGLTFSNLLNRLTDSYLIGGLTVSNRCLLLHYHEYPVIGFDCSRSIDLVSCPGTVDGQSVI